MRHTVRLKGVIVGHSDLEQIDQNLGRVWGVFRLEDAAGKPIRASTIHIADYSIERGNATGALELDVLISDDEYWARRCLRLWDMSHN